jgi:hypothetical protein
VILRIGGFGPDLDQCPIALAALGLLPNEPHSGGSSHGYWEEPAWTVSQYAKRHSLLLTEKNPAAAGFKVELPPEARRRLLVSMFLGVRFPRLLGVVSGMVGVPPCGVRMVRRFLVLPAVVMFRRFLVMAGGMRMMLWRLPVMFSCFLRHVMILI